jgi:hypothetical protein
MISSTTLTPQRRLPFLFTIIAVAALAVACAGGAGGGAPGPAAAATVGERTSSSSGDQSAVSGPIAALDAARSVNRLLDGALIVRTGALELEVKDFDVSLAKARTAIVGLGGYVSGSQIALDGDQPYGAVTYRVPSARWDEALTALESLSTKVVKEQTQAVEVTKSVVDLDAHIANLGATEQQLLTIMSKAIKITDILEVQSQLTNVRGEIEQLVAERDGLKDQAAYGTLAVGWTIPVVAVTAAQQGFDAATIVDSAVAQLVQLGQGLLTAGIWLAIVGLPLLIAALLILAVVLLTARRLGFGRPTPVAPDGAAAA